MSNENSLMENLKSAFAAAVIVIALVIGVLVYMFVLGNPSHFKEVPGVDMGGSSVIFADLGPNEHLQPKTGDFIGVVFMGGWIVPILIAINLIIITFAIERSITIRKAKGKGRLEAFIRTVRMQIANGDIDSAIAECDRQRGSLANVLRAGLTKYKFVETDTTMDKESKVAAIQKELEEATALELPMLSKNLVILSTCASIATLIGLIGTVVGMIRAFAALATEGGAPDTAALATGISEALINTALGITGSTLAIILYNYFTTKIDALTYAIDEAGFSVVQTFTSRHK